MDDMPVPTVPYKEFYSKNNAKYNAILVGGIASLAISIYIVSTVNILSYYCARQLNVTASRISLVDWRW